MMEFDLSDVRNAMDREEEMRRRRRINEGKYNQGLDGSES
jgi:hypothetical protein